MKTTFTTAALLMICSLAQAQIGGDINSIPPQHRAEFLRRFGSNNQVVGEAERMINGQRQRFINGRWQPAEGVGTPERIVNGRHEKFQDGHWHQVGDVGTAERIVNGERQQFINGRWRTVETRHPVRPNMPNPHACEMAGRWQCSDGAIWDLSQSGQNRLTGMEFGRHARSSLSGAWSGRDFMFRIKSDDGRFGYGMLSVERHGHRASGQILWEDGATTQLSMFRN